MTCYEIEPLLIDYLKATLKEGVTHCQEWKIKAHTIIHTEDYILGASQASQPNLFRDERQKMPGFTHIIMNPPYKKIHSASEYRVVLRKAGLETSNLYTGFLFLAAQQLEPDGEMVAIVPRSFCNGPYFKPFREQFFTLMTLRRLHIFETRDSAFKGDEVLQENIILHAVKGGERTTVRITTSRGDAFELDTSSGDCVVEDMTQRTVDYEALISCRRFSLLRKASVWTSYPTNYEVRPYWQRLAGVLQPFQVDNNTFPNPLKCLILRCPSMWSPGRAGA